MTKPVKSIFKNVDQLDIVKRLESSFLDYSASVIQGRAIPDLRDGLKPCDRRILFAMYRMGLRPDKQQRKCAAVVGEVIKSYHPHGDQSVYDVLVRLGQPFSMRVPLVDGKGNFGSEYSNSRAAAMRYTEARLHETSSLLLNEVDENTVEFAANFDESTTEPNVLPSQLPNVLINGAEGIAVGMSTNIPSHNPLEIIAALRLLVNNPKTTLEEIFKGGFQGPDFPSGGTIINGKEIRQMYETGKGSVLIRSKVKREESKSGKVSIVITETPPIPDRNKLIESIAKLVQEKVIDGIQTVRDESGREAACRIVIELKKDVDSEIILHKLWRLSDMEKSFSFQFLVIDNRTPAQLGLVSILSKFLAWRRETIKLRTQYRLNKAETRLHLVLGYLKAIDLIDEIVKIIQKAEGTEVAIKSLVRLGFTTTQAEAILDLRLRQLMRLEGKKLEDEKKELTATCTYLNSILNKPAQLDKVLLEELAEAEKMMSKYGKRLTEIKSRVQVLSDEELIPDEEVDIVISYDNYIRRSKVNGEPPKVVGLLSKINQRKNVYIITTKGRALTLVTHTIPEASGSNKGKALAQVIDDSVTEGEHPLYLGCPETPLLLVGSTGKAKLISPEDLISTRRKGIPIFPLADNEQLVTVYPVVPKHLVLVTSTGLGINTTLKDIPVQGRAAAGVRLIKLKDTESVVGTSAGKEVLVFGKGTWKNIDVSDIPQQGRGGKGVKIYEQPSSLPLYLAGDPNKTLLKSDGTVVVDRPSIKPRNSKATNSTDDFATLF